MLNTALIRFQVPLAILVLLLQRTPLLVKSSASLFSVPSIQILQKAVFTAAALGATHSLSGATNSKYHVNDDTYTVSNKTINHIEVNQVGEGVQVGLSNSIVTASWSVSGTIPPGLRITNLSKELEITNGYIDTPFPYILGEPTEAGFYDIDLLPWSDEGAQGESSPQILNIRFVIIPADIPEEAPDIDFSIHDGSLILSWAHNTQFTFDLEHSNNLALWELSPAIPTILDGQASVTISPAATQFAFYRLRLAQTQ